MHLKIYTDGACSGNPGPAAIGAVIKDERQTELVKLSRYIGTGTNNQAEYRAVIEALREAIKFEAARVTLYLDSELVAKQLTGKYRVKSPVLYPLYTEAADLLKNFANLSIIHVRRHDNTEADALAGAALKEFFKHDRV